MGRLHRLVDMTKIEKNRKLKKGLELFVKFLQKRNDPVDRKKIKKYVPESLLIEICDDYEKEAHESNT